jgi:hypothetical protein
LSRLGRSQEAIDHLHQALARHRELGNRIGEGKVLSILPRQLTSAALQHRCNCPRHACPMRKTRLGAALTVLFLSTAGLVAGIAAPASAATPTVFDLNGTYSDGGSARPVITNVNDNLTVNMSSQHRPNASGFVLAADRILVSFPDDTTYLGTLQAPGTILWSNGSAWSKTRPVPNLFGLTEANAVAAIQAAGFVKGTRSTFADHLCNFPQPAVGSQSPNAGAAALPGSAVSYTIFVATKPCF